MSGSGCADGELAVGAVHGVACLEGYHAVPAQFFEVHAEFGGRVAEGDVVVVVQAVDGVKFAAYVEGLGLGVQIADCWVFGVAAKYFFGFIDPGRSQSGEARVVEGTNLSGW